MTVDVLFNGAGIETILLGVREVLGLEWKTKKSVFGIEIDVFEASIGDIDGVRYSSYTTAIRFSRSAPLPGRRPPRDLVMFIATAFAEEMSTVVPDVDIVVLEQSSKEVARLPRA